MDDDMAEILEVQMRLQQEAIQIYEEKMKRKRELILKKEEVRYRETFTKLSIYLERTSEISIERTNYRWITIDHARLLNPPNHRDIIGDPSRSTTNRTHHRGQQSPLATADRLDLRR